MVLLALLLPLDYYEVAPIPSYYYVSHLEFLKMMERPPGQSLLSRFPLLLAWCSIANSV
jgi:hypothetical protein